MEFITELRLYNFVDMMHHRYHDAIDEWYRLLMQFVIFGEFYYKKSNLMILDNSCRLCTNAVIRVWFTCLMENRAKFSGLWQHLV